MFKGLNRYIGDGEIQNGRLPLQAAQHFNIQTNECILKAVPAFGNAGPNCDPCGGTLKVVVFFFADQKKKFLVS